MTRDNQEFIDLRDVVAVLRRRNRLIGLTLFVFLTVAFVYLTAATPLYTARALIRIDPQETNLLDPSDTGVSNASVEATRLETEVEILKSSNIGLQTITSLDLEQSEEFGPSVSLADQFKVTFGFDLPAPPSGSDLTNLTLSKFNDALSVRRLGLTYIVSVEATTPDPTLSASIANTHAAMYIQDQVTGRSEASIASRDVLQSQLQSARGNLEQSNDTLRNYIETNVIRLADEAGNRELASIGRRLQNITQQLSDFEDAVVIAQSARDSGDWETLAAQVGDDALSNLERQRVQLQQRLQASQVGSDEAFDLSLGLAALEGQIQERGEQVFERLETQMLNTHDSRIALLDEVQSTVLQSELSASTLADIYSLQQEAGIAQRQYDQLLSRIRDLETQSVLQVANSRVVSDAMVPSSPALPNRKVVFALALVAGVTFGIGFAFLKELYFGGITSASQLQNIIPTQVGGIIPKVNSSNVKEVLADRIVNDPMSPFAESFRKLRASIDEEIGEKKGGRVIMVTSAIPAEGKSTTALSLARVYAAAGKLTLLVDADLRNPSVHSFLGVEPESGLLEYLIEHSGRSQKGERVTGELLGGHSEVEQFYVVDPLTDGGVILGRKKAHTPTDAPLQSDVFVELINGARSSFDVIIIDTAPLVPVVDTRYVTPHVDAAVLCVRFGEASQSEVRSAFEQLVKAGRGNVKLVTALSCFEGRTRSYGYDGYYRS
ncbi:Wzz/FepE/Etk N-terminal domain-containing protein [Yoonia maritima]|uniref:Wzz/FepE/Etk N-terminal domain-containing protein n=1 Tax=Yoonia maritima TaxID=1435347 RepID=UPI000D0F82C0|nr:Wzz/FepE/Etk N-terminal domain-containing protein [Yoonia maritima]